MTGRSSSLLPRAAFLCFAIRRRWPKYLPRAEWIRVPGNHLSMLIGRNAVRLAAEITEQLKRVAQA